MWRSRNSGSKRSSAWICSSVSLILRLRTVCSSRSSRSWRVLRPPEDPHAPHPARTDLEPSEHQLVGLERMGEDRLLDQGRDAVGVRSPRSRQPVEQPSAPWTWKLRGSRRSAGGCSRRSGTPSRRCRVPERAVARTASGALSSLPGRWSFWFSSGLLSGLDTFSINLGEAGLATVPFGGHLSGDCRSTTYNPRD